MTTKTLGDRAGREEEQVQRFHLPDLSPRSLDDLLAAPSPVPRPEDVQYGHFPELPIAGAARSARDTDGYRGPVFPSVAPRGGNGGGGVRVCYHVHPVVPRRWHALLGSGQRGRRWGNVLVPPPPKGGRPTGPPDGGAASPGSETDDWRGRLGHRPMLLRERTVAEMRMDELARRTQRRGSPPAGPAAGAEVVEAAPAQTAVHPSRLPITQQLFLARDEWNARKALVWEECVEALRTLPFPWDAPFRPPCEVGKEGSGGDTTASSSVHPAWHDALVLLTTAERIGRREIDTEEGGVFHRAIRVPQVYERRVLEVGTLPLERFVRHWVNQHQGRKLLFSLRREHLVERERRGRAELEAALRRACWDARFGALVGEEERYRCALATLEAKASCAAGMVSLRLREQVDRFPLVYGCPMSRANGIARLRGNTIFALVLQQESYQRGRVMSQEAAEREGLPCAAQSASLHLFLEPTTRRRREREEAEEREVLHHMLDRLEVYYTLKDVEMYEAAERDVCIERVGRRWEMKAHEAAALEAFASSS